MFSADTGPYIIIDQDLKKRFCTDQEFLFFNSEVRNLCESSLILTKCVGEAFYIGGGSVFGTRGGVFFSVLFCTIIPLRSDSYLVLALTNGRLCVQEQ